MAKEEKEDRKIENKVADQWTEGGERWAVQEICASTVSGVGVAI